MKFSQQLFSVVGAAALGLCALGMGMAGTAARAAQADAPAGVSSQDFAYRRQVITDEDAAAYRVTLPTEVYKKLVQRDLADLRVFNSDGEMVPYAITQPAAATTAGATTELSLFPLEGDTDAALDALKITVESGKTIVHVNPAQPNAASQTRAYMYIIDARAIDAPIFAFQVRWPENAPDFAQQLRIEVSDRLDDWRTLNSSAPVANLHSGSQHLLEQRLEFSPTHAKFWRLSWVSESAPVILSSVLAESAGHAVETQHESQTVTATAGAAGQFEYDLGASFPVDRVNLKLPDLNTVVDVNLLSRAKPTDPWRSVGNRGFYRLRNENEDEVSNGPVPVGLNTDRYWAVRTDAATGGLGRTPPHLVVEWQPHEVVFLARGKAPFYINYGSATVPAAAGSLAMLPKTVEIAMAELANQQIAGGEEKLRPPPEPYAWKTLALWVVLVAGAALLGFMALRLAREFSRS